MENDEKIGLIKAAIKKLYLIDKELIERDLCERCLVHRLALHLGNNLKLKRYFIDCEFNRAFTVQANTLKRLASDKGNYVDIIVHKRGNPLGDNLICIEVKKVKNRNKNAIEKDEKNLEILTGARFAYKLGFYINLGNSYETTTIKLYSQGNLSRELKLSS